jgi:pilus assembly protein FimV
MIALAMGLGCLLPLVGHTLGLGDIEVNSALNQELDARIKLLSAVPEDTQNLIVKLATRDEFNQAGIDRPFLLQSLKFTTEVKDGVPYIKVTSTKPIREPYLDFLIEIDWPKGHLMREYTILLDPPVFTHAPSDVRPAVANASSRPGAVSAPPAAADETSMRPGMSMSAAPAGSTENVAAPSAQQQTSSASSASSVPAAAPATMVTNNNATYAAPKNSNVRIKKGDTAWSLAKALRPDQSISTEQMMVALLRTNPESFIKDNVNGLKRGYILRIPDRSEIARISQSEAVAMVHKQNSLWRQYQHNLNGGTTAASAMSQSDTDKNATGSTDKSNAHLTIVSAGKGAGTGAAGNVDASKMSASELRAQLALVQERLESERLEKQNLQGEVGDLQKQVDKMKRLLSIEDNSMAEMQSTADKNKNAKQQPAATETKTEADQTAKPAADTTTVAKTEAEKPAAETKPESEAKPASATAESKPADKDKVFVDNKDKSQAVAQPQPQPQKTTPQMPVSQPRRGLLASVMGNPLILGAIGAGVLLLMALVFMIVKRRRVSAIAVTPAGDASDDDLANVADMLDDQAINENVSDEEVETSMAAAEGEAEKFDSDATMVLPSANDTVVTQAEPQEDEEPRDDVIAEADVYLAYGIYQQAEELLQNAIKEHPDNDAYRMKLAETYFAGKNVSGFGDLAAEMHERTKGTGSRWQKLVAMGKELIPGHELFQGASSDTEVALDDLVPSPEPMDIDLGLDDTRETAAPDLDFSLGDDSELELPDTTDDTDLNLEDDTPAAPLEELEFDLSETDAAIPEAEASTKSADEELSLDFEASDLGISIDDDDAETDNSLDFDLDLSAEAEGEDELADTPKTAEESELEEEFGLLDEPETTEESEDEFDIDVSEELGASATIVTTSDELTGGNASGEGDIDLSDLDDVDEVSTKLDLARAYLDMGDSEGTRSILEEVVAEGNAEQKAEAEALLAEING